MKSKWLCLKNVVLNRTKRKRREISWIYKKSRPYFLFEESSLRHQDLIKRILFDVNLSVGTSKLISSTQFFINGNVFSEYFHFTSMSFCLSNLNSTRYKPLLSNISFHVLISSWICTPYSRLVPFTLLTSLVLLSCSWKYPFLFFKLQKPSFI